MTFIVQLPVLISHVFVYISFVFEFDLNLYNNYVALVSQGRF